MKMRALRRLRRATQGRRPRWYDHGLSRVERKRFRLKLLALSAEGYVVHLPRASKVELIAVRGH